MSTVFNTPDMYPALKRRVLAVVPNVAPEAVSAKNCYILQIVISNTTGGALTLDVIDVGGPTELMNDVSFAANSLTIFSFGQGVFMDAGFTIQASGAGINAEVVYRESQS